MFHIKYNFIISLEIYYFRTFTQVKVIQRFTWVQESTTFYSKQTTTIIYEMQCGKKYGIMLWNVVK